MNVTMAQIKKKVFGELVLVTITNIFLICNTKVNKP